MSATKSIIEQADEIVGITGEVRIANMNSTTYRRGAYVGWLLSNHEADETMVCGTVAHSAECIVRLHAASKPKATDIADGLNFTADRMSMATVTNGDGTAKVIIHIVGRGDDACALSDYINRCLTPPVRRMLAAFEVVESRSVGFYKLNTVMLHRNGQDVCWLVLKGVRP